MQLAIARSRGWKAEITHKVLAGPTNTHTKDSANVGLGGCVFAAVIDEPTVVPVASLVTVGVDESINETHMDHRLRIMGAISMLWGMAKLLQGEHQRLGEKTVLN